MINQNTFEKIPDDKIQALKDEIVAKSDELTEKKDSLKSLKAELNIYDSRLTIDEMKLKIKELEEVLKDREKKVSILSKHEKVDPNLRNKLTMKIKELRKERRKRSFAAKDLIDKIADGYPKSREILLEEIGLD